MDISDLIFLKTLQSYGEITPYVNEKIQNIIIKYQYPFGALLQVLSQVINPSQSYSQNLQYYNTIIPIIYSEVYTEEEIHILSILCAVQLAGYYDVDGQMKSDIQALWNKTSDKLEITYCLNTLKYRYVQMIIMDNPNAPELNLLLLELEALPSVAKETLYQRKIVI